LAVDVVGCVLMMLKDSKVPKLRLTVKSRWNNQNYFYNKRYVEIEETYTKSSVVTKMD
jgi:hypothetical protein